MRVSVLESSQDSACGETIIERFRDNYYSWCKFMGSTAQELSGSPYLMRVYSITTRWFLGEKDEVRTCGQSVSEHVVLQNLQSTTEPNGECPTELSNSQQYVHGHMLNGERVSELNKFRSTRMGRWDHTNFQKSHTYSTWAAYIGH